MESCKEKEYSVLYQRECVKILREKYGEGIYFNKDQIEIICDTALDYYCKAFTNLCSKINSYKFYVDILSLNDGLFEMSQKDMTDNKICDSKRSDFALKRKIIKLILAEACKLNLCKSSVLSPQQSEEYTLKLFFLGGAAYEVAQHIHSLYILGDNFFALTITEHDYQFQAINPLVNLFFYQLNYRKATDFFIKSCGEDIQTQIVDFVKITEKTFGTNETLLIELFGKMEKYVIYDFSEYYDKIHSTYSSSFSDGLILNKTNVLTIKESILKPYSKYRTRFRPILEWNIDKKKKLIYTSFLILEAWGEIISNGIPWGLVPIEWSNNKLFMQYVYQKENEHDKWLDNSVEKLLLQINLPFLKNKKAINGISLERKKASVENNVGEIDFIFIDDFNKIVYVVDCKNNRTRYDMSSWSIDASNFKSYNLKLKKKNDWIALHLNDVECEFKKKYKDVFNLSAYTVTCFFIIDTFTFYLYNSEYRIIPLKKLAEAIKVKMKLYHDIELENHICRAYYPIFDNIQKNNYEYILQCHQTNT